MKSVITAITFFALASLVNQAIAECPSSLTTEQMQECITTENDGYYFSARGKTATMEEEYVEPSATDTSESDDDTQHVVSTKEKTP